MGPSEHTHVADAISASKRVPSWLDLGLPLLTVAGAKGATAYRLLVDEAPAGQQDTMQHQMARLAEVPEMTLKRLQKIAPNLEEPISLALATRELTRQGESPAFAAS